MITTACDVGVADRSQLDKHSYRPATSKLGNHRVSLERPSLGFLSYICVIGVHELNLTKVTAVVLWSLATISVLYSFPLSTDPARNLEQVDP